MTDVTTGGLGEDLRALGVAPGQTLMVHSSMRSIGWVEGGAPSVVAALTGVLGPEGTLVVPVFTTANSDSSPWYHAATEGMSAEEARRFRDEMPPFDPATTPSTGMGAVAEAVRLSPGAVRSAHPQTSYAAIGPLAGKLVSGHDAECHHGEDSPLARLYDIGGHVLLMGVGFDRCTVFHLAEYRYLHPRTPTRLYRCVVRDGDGRKWWEFTDVILDDSDFAQLGADFAATGNVRRGMVGGAHCHFFPVRQAVDFAVSWMRRERKPGN
ncbi:aminoglycoside N(3)-acetyltransferase [Herbidospora cretacea]|uniref:aminoglycoside N(3)-acetyltransferase n=1 Tax=Herbidospora cretacea TaxID=28444 RepID=UPI0006904B8E|nr:AAC(3) family N-acetyltransferase [Herbidospora cretacea]